MELFPHSKGRPDGIFTEGVNSACILSSSEPVGGGVQWVGHGIHFHPLEAGHSVQAASVLHQYWWAQSGWSCFGVKVNFLAQIQTTHPDRQNKITILKYTAVMQLATVSHQEMKTRVS